MHRKTRHTGLVAAPSAALIGAALSIGFVPGASADELPEQASAEASAHASANARADVAVTATQGGPEVAPEHGERVSAQVQADQADDTGSAHVEDDEELDGTGTPATPTRTR